MAISFVRLVQQERQRRCESERQRSAGKAARPAQEEAGAADESARAASRVAQAFAGRPCPVDKEQVQWLGDPAPAGSVGWVPDALSAEQEEALVAAADAGGWHEVRGRRLQVHGTDPHSGSCAPLAPWLGTLLDWLGAGGDAAPAQCSSRPNHVLVNEYARGEGIMAHTDGPCYEDSVCILSCGGPCVMHFRANVTARDVGTARDRTLFSLALPARSALLFRGPAYWDMRHGIEAVSEDTVGWTAAGKPSPCLNAAAALGTGAGPGTRLERGRRRVSLTIRRAREPGVAEGQDGPGVDAL